MANDDKDPIWKYAKPTPDRNKFECTICNRIFQGGPEKIKYHLSGVGGKCIRACEELSPTGKVTDDVWNEAFSELKVYLGKKFGKSLNVASKKRKAVASSSCPDGGLSEISNPPPIYLPRDEVAYSLAMLVEMGGINDNLVESPYFTNFVNAVLKSGPACKLPSLSELRSQWMPSIRTEVEEYVRSAKQSWITTGCTLVPISWFNEILGNHFLSIFGCTVERTVLLKTVEIPVGDTVNLLGGIASTLVIKLGSDNIVQCLRDGSDYAEHFSNVLHGCIPHLKSAYAANEIQSLFQRICDEVGWVKATLALNDFGLKLNDFDLKLNADLMQGHSRGTGQMWKIVHEEFRRHMSISHFEAQYVDNGESAHRPLKLCFMTPIGSPIRISQIVEGQNGCRIRVCLVDSSTGRVVQNGIPSRLSLIVSVLDGYFSNEAPSGGQLLTEASSEDHSTREYFNRNELSRSEFPYITGVLAVGLRQGEGTLGDFSFNYSSVHRESRLFKLAVKTDTGFCDGFRILEGISNAFIVEDAQGAISTQLEVAHVDPQNGSSSSNLGWRSDIDDWIKDFPDHTLPTSNDTCYYSDQGLNHCLAQTAARRVKKKTLTMQLRSRGREVTLKKGSQTLAEKEVPESRSRVCSTGSNNVIQEEDGKAVELKGIDSLSSTSALNSSSGAKSVGETNELTLPTHPSTALQLSLTGDRVLEPQKAQLQNANDANQQTAYKKGRKRDDLWEYAERMHSRFMCTFCRQVFSGGVVRLQAHLSGTRGQGIRVCIKVPEDVKSAVLLASNNGPIKKKSKLCCKEILSASDEEKLLDDEKVTVWKKDV